MASELWEIVRADELKVGDVATWGSPDDFEEFEIKSIKPVFDEDGEATEEIEVGIGPNVSIDLGNEENLFRRCTGPSPEVLMRALEIACIDKAETDSQFTEYCIELARRELEQERTDG